MRASHPSGLFLVLAFLALPAGRAGAQFVLGPGADAATLPKGTVRTTISAEQGIDRGRFNNGDAEPLGAAFSVASFGRDQHTALATLGYHFSSLGVPDFAPSLGAVTLNLRQRVQTTRLGFEVGFFDWLTVGVDVPFVRTRAEALLRLDGSGGLATAGRNPLELGTAVGAANGATILSYHQAVAALASRRTDCEANAGAHPECGIILAEAGAVSMLGAMTSNFATRLGLAYGGTGYGDGLPFVPMTGSTGETALSTRADSMRLAFERYGVTAIDSAALLPLGAQTPLNATDLALMVGTGFANGGGFGARPMTRTAFQEIGDVDLMARISLYDRLTDTTVRVGIRQTVGVTYRFGAGHPDAPDNFIDLGTGTGANGIALRSFTDVRVRDRIFATLTLGYLRLDGYEREMRVPFTAEASWLEEGLTRVVSVEPGSTFEIGISPRWQATDHFVVSAEWRRRDKAADGISGTFGSLTTYGEVFTPQPAGIEGARAWDETRLAWSVSYSTLTDVAAGRTRLPIEIGYTHEQTAGNSTGIVPQRFTDRIQIRFYTRLFGR
jgi:hypothetical protein